MIVGDPDFRPISKTPFPPDASIFDYYPNPQSNKWEFWTKRITGFDIPKDPVGAATGAPRSPRRGIEEASGAWSDIAPMQELHSRGIHVRVRVRADDPFYGFRS